MFTVISKFEVAGGGQEAVKDAFRNRPHMVEQAQGFLRLDVISPLDKCEEVWLITHWQDQSSYDVWYRSHEYHKVHEMMPKGMKLIPGSTEIRLFEYVCD